MSEEKMTLEPLREFIEKANLVDDRVFANVVKRALTELRMVPGEMARGLGLADPTVHRWISGVGPHEAMKEPVRRFFLKKIAERQGAA